MNDILLSLRKITLALNFLLLSVLMIIIPKMHSIYNILIYLTILILFIFLVRELLSKKGLYNEILFNGASVISMIYILIVIIRSMTDSYIMINFLPINIYSNSGMMFLSSNFVFILIITLGLIIYNILMMIGEEKND
jgi:hypothetical protein